MSTSGVHHDPISGVPIKVGAEYAQIDGLYFASLQTQQTYFQALEKGFEVKWVGGKPQLLEHVFGPSSPPLESERGYFRSRP